MASNLMPTPSLDALAAYGRPHGLDDRHDCIAQLAYQHAARRGFATGHELDDWLEAEREVDARLTGEWHPF
jgi:membrane-bound lytic murein transglycosylase B